MANFRQEVNRKSPATIPLRRTTRRFQKSERGGRRGQNTRGRRGHFCVCGRGRGRGRGNNNKRKVNAKQPHSYPVSLIDGAILDAHAYYYLGADIWIKLPPRKAAYITNNGNEYTRQKTTHALASLHA